MGDPEFLGRKLSEEHSKVSGDRCKNGEQGKGCGKACIAITKLKSALQLEPHGVAHLTDAMVSHHSKMSTPFAAKVNAAAAAYRADQMAALGGIEEFEAYRETARARWTPELAALYAAWKGEKVTRKGEYASRKAVVAEAKVARAKAGKARDVVEGEVVEKAALALAQAASSTPSPCARMLP